MNKTQILERLYLLFLVLQYDSQQEKKLTAGDRILINQERGQLLCSMDYTKTELRPVPAALETKIQDIAHLIHATNFYPLNPKNCFHDSE